MKLKMPSTQFLVFSLMLQFVVSLVNAQELDVTDFGDQKPSTDEFISALEPQVLTRGIEPSEPAKNKSVSLGIQFMYDSHELTEEAQETLNGLGGALSSEQLSEYRFMLEGHTDAAGDSEYNQQLSENRALSVRNYLVNVFGIEASRLDNIGRGETALLDEADPESSANRRVLIINLTQ